jgi:glycosyltransferase involved in cell wall biosynthesis
MKNKLVTIIVNVYNGEKYLKECLDSVVNQTYKNIEIILVNDGSFDNSEKIIESYQNLKIINQENQGVSIARNNAISASTGEYICFVDQDDILDKNYIEYFLNLILKNDADVALTTQSDKFYKKIHKCTSKDKIRIMNGKEATIEMLYHKFVIAPWNKMIKSSLIKKNKIEFNPNFFNGEGFAFSIECFLNSSKVVVGTKKVYHYRVGDPESGASKFSEKSIISSLNAQEYIREKLYNDKEINKAWNFSNWHTNCDCFNIFIGCNAKNKNLELYNKIYKKCQKDALCALTAPVNLQQKLRGILFKINPVLAAKIINKFRIRKFKK